MGLRCSWLPSWLKPGLCDFGASAPGWNRDIATRFGGDTYGRIGISAGEGVNQYCNRRLSARNRVAKSRFRPSAVLQMSQSPDPGHALGPVSIEHRIASVGVRWLWHPCVSCGPGGATPLVKTSRDLMASGGLRCATTCAAAWYAGPALNGRAAPSLCACPSSR